jgi:hypothetical protein
MGEFKVIHTGPRKAGSQIKACVDGILMAQIITESVKSDRLKATPALLTEARLY